MSGFTTDSNYKVILDAPNTTNRAVGTYFFMKGPYFLKFGGKCRDISLELDPIRSDGPDQHPPPPLHTDSFSGKQSGFPE